jgi:hypothetical protein
MLQYGRIRSAEKAWPEVPPWIHTVVGVAFRPRMRALSALADTLGILEPFQLGYRWKAGSKCHNMDRKGGYKSLAGGTSLDPHCTGVLFPTMERRSIGAGGPTQNTRTVLNVHSLDSP